MRQRIFLKFFFKVLQSTLFIGLCTAGTIFSYPQLSENDSHLFRNRQRAIALYILALQKKKEEIYRWHKAYRDCAGFIQYTLWEVFERDLEKNPHANLLRVYPAVTRPNFPLLKNARGNGVRHIQARDMMQYNARFLGKSSKTTPLKSGDWLFFHTGKNWHAMLLLENPVDKSTFLIIYHTGEKAGGEIRLLHLQDLWEHPQKQWHPDPGNSAFLGFFRPHFLSD